MQRGKVLARLTGKWKHKKGPQEEGSVVAPAEVRHG